MFKKTLLVVALAAASSAAMASGFYAGAGVGANSDHYRLTDVNGDKFDTGNLGFVGGALAGYTYDFGNQFALGGEAFFNGSNNKVTIDNAQTDTDTGADTVTFKQRYEYGVRVLPAYLINPTTDVHAILGYVRGNFKFTDSDPDVGSITKNRNGFQVGAGLGTEFAKNVGFRADVTYNGFQKYNLGNGNNIKINGIEGIGSVVYKFG